MRPDGEITRGTTNPGRLRRVDRWITQAQQSVLRTQERPLIVDLGFGASPVTTVELYRRIRAVVPDAEVTGLEIDPERVAAAAAAWRRCAPPGTRCRGSRSRGRVRAADGAAAGAGPRVQRAAPVPGGTGLDGLGPAAGGPGRPAASSSRAPATRSAAGPCGSPSRAAVAARAGSGQPLITFSARLASLERPSDLAERLPKALIHRNVPGEPVHQFLRDFDRAWDSAAPYSAFGSRQRWLAAVTSLSAAWPVIRRPPQGGHRRWRLGEVTLPWAALAPPGV